MCRNKMWQGEIIISAFTSVDAAQCCARDMRESTEKRGSHNMTGTLCSAVPRTRGRAQPAGVLASNITGMLYSVVPGT